MHSNTKECLYWSVKLSVRKIFLPALVQNGNERNAMKRIILIYNTRMNFDNLIFQFR